MAKTPATPEAATSPPAVNPAAPPAPTPNALPVFDQAVAFVLRDRIEGGYVNDKRDPGGETKYGISARSYPREDIKNLTRERAIDLYKRDYWTACRCDDLPPQLAVAMFDCAVNQGVGAAKLLLQRALGVAADGIIGPVTLKAAASADQEEAVLDLLGWRLHRYAHTTNVSTYMRGWSNRVLRLLAFILTDLKVA